jgi:hypothetical protein
MRVIQNRDLCLAMLRSKLIEHLSSGLFHVSMKFITNSCSTLCQTTLIRIR